MYFKLKNQKGVITKAIKKAGAYRRLGKILKISKSSIFEYSKGRPISRKNLDKIITFLKIKNKEKIILENLPNNWKQIKGGKRLVGIKKLKGTFEKEMKVWRDFQSKKLKKWHKFMKINKPEGYYNLQYSRFKKIAGYKYQTKNGEKVRNSFEKETADILKDLKIDYEYEPLINIDKNYFFPDFLINKKIIIECTMWKGLEKAYKLKSKIDMLKKKYNVYVLIPKNLYSYYKILNHHLILGLDEFVLVAQTFKAKTLKKEQ